MPLVFLFLPNDFHMLADKKYEKVVKFVNFTLSINYPVLVEIYLVYSRVYFQKFIPSNPVTFASPANYKGAEEISKL